MTDLQSQSGIEQRAILSAIFWARHTSTEVDQACTATPTLRPERRADDKLTMAGITATGGKVSFRLEGPDLVMFRGEILPGDNGAAQYQWGETTLPLPDRLQFHPARTAIEQGAA